jgi:hypothetical protein
MAGKTTIDNPGGRDQQAEKASRGRWARAKDWMRQGDSRSSRALRVVNERIPGSDMRGEMKDKKAATSEVRQEQYAQEMRAEMGLGGPAGADPTEGEGQEEKRGRTPKGSAEGTGGDFIEVNRELIKAIRSGQNRDDSKSEETSESEDKSKPDMLMRQVVMQEQFIAVVEGGTVPTPREQMNTAYKDRMREVRAELAEDLRNGTVKELDSDKMDIIYSTLLGQMHVFDAEGEPIYKRDQDGNFQKDGNGDKVPVLFWETSWPEDIPLPNDAFFKLVESVTSRSHAGNEGQYLGNVLKALTGCRTIHGENQDPTLRFLVDENYVDAYLEKRTAKPIEQAVKHFQEYVKTLLVMPESEMHPELKLAGTGYFLQLSDGRKVRNDEEVIQALRNKDAEVKLADQSHKSAEQEVETAIDKHREAQNVTAAARDVVEGTQHDLEAAEERLRDALALNADVEAGRRQMSRVELEQRLQAADADVERTGKEVRAAKAQLSNAEIREEELLSLVENAIKDKTEKQAKHMRLGEALRIMEKEEAQEYTDLVRTLTDNFRSELLGQMSGGDLESTISSKTEKWVVNLSIANLVKDAKELVVLMDDSLKLVPLDLQSHWLDMTDDELKEAFKKDKLSVEKLEAIHELRKLKKETHDTFKYKMDEFTEKVNEFKGSVDKARLHPDLRTRMMMLATAIESRRQTRDDLQHIIEDLGTVHGYPLGKAAKASLEKLQKRTKANVCRIPDGEFIVARMIFESQKDVPPSAQPQEGKWKKFWDKVFWHVFTVESWIGKSKKHRKTGEPRQGKLISFYRWTWGQTVDDLKPCNFKDPIIGKNPKDGKAKVYEHYRRGYRGIWKGIVKTAFWIGLGFAIASAPPNPQRAKWEWYSYIWPGNWIQHTWHHVTNVGHYWDHFWRPPWQWFSAHETAAPRKRVISDSYDDPSKLADRPLQYYATAFGVNDEDNQKWLKDHEGVLRYFQERRTLKRVLRVTPLPDNDRNCSQVKGQRGSTKKGPAKVDPSKQPSKTPGKTPATAQGRKDVSFSIFGGNNDADERKERFIAKVQREYGRQIPEDEIEKLHKEFGEKIPVEALNRLKYKHMKVNRWAKLALEHGQTIPKSCKALGIGSVDEVTDYQPLAKRDRWEKGNPFCCTVSIEYEVISDGQMLNRAKADEFVRYLRDQEDKGRNVTYTYITQNSHLWLQRGFHISRNQDKVMDLLGISSLDRVNFVLAQGTTHVLDSKSGKRVPVLRVAKGLLEPLVQRKEPPESQPAGTTTSTIDAVIKAERIVPGHREAFLAEWELRAVEAAKTDAQTRARESSLNPSKVQPINARRSKVSDPVLERSFNAALKTGRSKGWVEDFTESYQRQKLMEALPDTKLDEKRAYVLLAPKNAPIRELLLKIQREPSGKYRINPGMINQFIDELSQHRAAGGDVSDYDPYDKGSRTTWAIESGLIKASPTKTAPTAARASQPEATPEPAIPMTGDKFKSILDGTIKRLFTDEGEDGQAAKAAYGGDKAKAEKAMRAEIQKMLTADGTSSARRRSNYGLQVTKGDADMSVDVTSVGKARRGIRGHLVRFLKGKSAQ